MLADTEFHCISNGFASAPSLYKLMHDFAEKNGQSRSSLLAQILTLGLRS